MDWKYLNKVAVGGRSGAGKTTVARYLAIRYGFHYCSSGAVCRQVTSMLLGDESKFNLNRVCLALRTIDPSIWFRAALAQVPLEQRIVYDGLRFREDLELAQSMGFVILRVDASLDVRRARLRARGQEMSEADEQHICESHLDGCVADACIENSFAQVDQLWSCIDHTGSVLSRSRRSVG